MSGSTAKAERRDLRRAVGDSALDVIENQSTAIGQLVTVSNGTQKRLDAIELAHAVFVGQSFTQRLKWVIRGR